MPTFKESTDFRRTQRSKIVSFCKVLLPFDLWLLGMRSILIRLWGNFLFLASPPNKITDSHESWKEFWISLTWRNAGKPVFTNTTWIFVVWLFLQWNGFLLLTYQFSKDRPNDRFLRELKQVFYVWKSAYRAFHDTQNQTRINERVNALWILKCIYGRSFLWACSNFVTFKETTEFFRIQKYKIVSFLKVSLSNTHF